MPAGSSPRSAHVFGSQVNCLIALPVIPSLTPITVALSINANPITLTPINK